MTDEGTVTVHATDDLMTRAEKIVHFMGFRGAVGGYAINVFRLLQAYEKADREYLAQERKKLDDVKLKLDLATEGNDA